MVFWGSLILRHPHEILISSHSQMFEATKNGVCCLFLRGAALQETTFGTCPDCCMRAKSCVASHHKRASWRLKGYFHQMFGGKKTCLQEQNNLWTNMGIFINIHFGIDCFLLGRFIEKLVVLHRNSNVSMANYKITPHQRLIVSLKVAMTAVSTKPRRCPVPKNWGLGAKRKGKKAFHIYLCKKHSWSLTAKAPKRKGSSSNRYFSAAMWNFGGACVGLFKSCFNVC